MWFLGFCGLIKGWRTGLGPTLKYNQPTNFMKPFLFCLASTSIATVASFVAGVHFSTPTYKAADNGLMTNVPTVGYSRVETVSMCLQDAKVKVYQDLMTDSQFETFNTCLHDNT